MTPLPKCGRCKEVEYCNRKCQKRHWNEHSIACGRREFTITIIGMHGERFTIAKCRRGTFVREIKQDLQRQTESLPQHFSLRWHAKTLADDDVLGRIGISAGAELMLTVEFPVTVRKLGGGEIAIPDCNEYMTVHELKSRISAITGISYQHHRLLLGLRAVHDRNMLDEEGIVANAVLSLVMEKAHDSDSDTIPSLISSSGS